MNRYFFLLAPENYFHSTLQIHIQFSKVSLQLILLSLIHMLIKRPLSFVSQDTQDDQVGVYKHIMYQKFVKELIIKK